jgi:hypothetical protein
MLISHHKNAGQNHNIMIANRPTENVENLKKCGNNSNKPNSFMKKLRAD